MSGLVDNLLGVNGAVVYLLVGMLVFAEDALFVGFVLPGETAAILGGVDASRGHVGLVPMALVVVVAAVAGDTAGYVVGRRFGPHLLQTRVLAKHQRRLGAAQDFLARRGGPAVFFARFVAFLRAAMPALAGAAAMRYRTFLAFNVAGGLVWGIGCVVLGYVAGNSYKAVEQTVGRGVAVTIAVVAVVGLVAWRLRRRATEHRG